MLAGWLGNVSTNVVVRLTDGGGSCVASSDQLQVWNAANTAQTNLGTVCLGGTGYNTSASTITFGATGTPSTIVQGAFTVADTITLGTPSATAATQAGNTTAVWTPSGSMYDQAGTNYSTSPSPGSTIDNTAPTISATRICGGSRCSADFVGQGKTYFVYANATDANAGIDGTTGVKADVSNITTGATAVALTTCSSNCTVNGTTYTYKSAQQTANGTLSGTKTWTLTVKDNDLEPGEHDADGDGRQHGAHRDRKHDRQVDRDRPLPRRQAEDQRHLLRLRQRHRREQRRRHRDRERRRGQQRDHDRADRGRDDCRAPTRSPAPPTTTAAPR